MNDRPNNESAVEVTIRPASESDAPLLAKMRYVFRSSLSPAQEGEDEFVMRCTDWMRHRLGRGGRWRCWVAEQGQEPVGNLWMQLIEKIPNPVDEPEYHGYVTNFYISEDARNKGIGSMLLSAALDWARSHDVQAVILWPTEKSRPLYLRHGFAVREDIFGKTLLDE